MGTARARSLARRRSFAGACEAWAFDPKDFQEQSWSKCEIVVFLCIPQGRLGTPDTYSVHMVVFEVFPHAGETDTKGSKGCYR